MTKEPWNKHTPGDPMPCKCGDSVVEVVYRLGGCETLPAKDLHWGKFQEARYYEITGWGFAERKGDDVLAADSYNDLEWDNDGIATVVLKKPGQPGWVRVDDLVRFHKASDYLPASEWGDSWDECFAFQIKRRPVLIPAVPQPGEQWRHHSGRIYTVLFLTNNEGDGVKDKYPVTVVYQGGNGKRWSGPLSDWHRRMTLVDDEAAARRANIEVPE